MTQPEALRLADALDYGVYDAHRQSGGEDMTPTNKLRFVEREDRHWVDDRTYNIRRIRVLQQWWEDKDSGEWRDVPLETEEI